jgi:hypothetical protein
LTFKGSSSGCRNSSGRQSAGTWWTVREEPDSTSVLRVLREFLHVFRSIDFVTGFLLHGVRGRSVLECRMVCDGGRSAGPSQTVCYCGCSIGGSGVIFGRSAAATRTVHLGLVNGPPGACGRSAWSRAELLSPLLFEFRFRFGIVWGFLLWLLGPL